MRSPPAARIRPRALAGRICRPACPSSKHNPPIPYRACNMNTHYLCGNIACMYVCILRTSLAVPGKVKRSALMAQRISQRVRRSEIEMQSNYNMPTSIHITSSQVRSTMIWWCLTVSAFLLEYLQEEISLGGIVEHFQWSGLLRIHESRERSREEHVQRVHRYIWCHSQ